MTLLIELFQEGVKILDIIKIKDVSIVGICIAICLYFWNENKQLKKDLKDKIKDNQNFLKEASNDQKMFIEKYHEFIRSLETIINNK